MKSTAFIIQDFLSDSGKGTIVDSFTRKFNSNLTIRFNGGSQAAHNVIDENGRHHTFAQFGSGTFAGARTLLSRGMMVDPISLEIEEGFLQKIGITETYNNLFVDEGCSIITPFHIKVNQLLEISRGENKHSSCGKGIWETRLDYLNRGQDGVFKIVDLRDKDIIFDKLTNSQLAMLQRLESLGLDTKDFNLKIGIINLVDLYYEIGKRFNILNNKEIKQLINSSNNPVLEGAQGILLDEKNGFLPYVSGSDTTSKNALDLLKDCGWDSKNIEIIGVTRTYATRHGNGPLVTHEPHLNDLLPELHNTNGEWQGEFRRGYLDLVLLNYCIQVNGGITYLAVTHADCLEKRDVWPICTDYYDGNELWFPFFCNNNRNNEKVTERLFKSKPVYKWITKERIIPFISEYLETPVILESFGPKSNQKTWYWYSEEMEYV